MAFRCIFLLGSLLLATAAHAEEKTVQIDPELVKSVIQALTKQLIAQCGEMDQAVRGLRATLTPPVMPRRLEQPKGTETPSGN